MAHKSPLVDEHAFPPMDFAVARLGCSLQYEDTKKYIHINALMAIKVRF